MMATRLLPADEWHRLPDDTEIPWRELDPDRNIVIVTERDGEITGTVVLMQAVHAEFLWIAPADRGRVSVGRHLRARMLAEARRFGPTVLMAAMTKTMNRIVCGLGADRLPGDHYVLAIREKTECHRL